MTGGNQPRRKVLGSAESALHHRGTRTRQELTSTALRIPTDEERLAFNSARSGGQTHGEIKVSAYCGPTVGNLRSVYHYGGSGRRNGDEEGGDGEQLHCCAVRETI